MKIFFWILVAINVIFFSVIALNGVKKLQPDQNPPALNDKKIIIVPFVPVSGVPVTPSL